MLINFDHLKTTYNALVHKLKALRGNWSQNDPAADDYIKNRPFYEEPKVEELVSNLTAEEYNNGDYPPCNFVVGNEYKVVWNGESYSGLVCYSDGDYNVIGGDGYPFYIDDDGGGGLYIQDTVGDGDSFTISIYCDNIIVHKLDTKYLPDNIVTLDTLNEVLPDNLVTSDNIADALPDNVATSDELAAVATSGSYNDLSNKPTIYTDTVRYTSQTLSDVNKTQARANINAAAVGDSYLKDEIYQSIESAFEHIWDGNTDGIEDIINVPRGESSLPFYKVSNTTIPYENIITATGKTTNHHGLKSSITSLISGVGCYTLGDSSAYDYLPYIMVVTQEGECSYTYQGSTVSFTAPSTGLYMYRGSSQYYTYGSHLSITYQVEQTGIYLNDTDLNKHIVSINTDGAISTTGADGNVVTMASTADIPDSYTKSESDAKYASSWNDLTDKPFYEETETIEPITWDGNTEGLVEFDIFGNKFYKVSDKAFSNEQIKTMSASVYDSWEDEQGNIVSGVYPVILSDHWDGLVQAGAITDDYAVLVPAYVIVARKNNVELQDGVMLPEIGTYFAKADQTDEDNYSLSYPTSFPSEAITETTIKKVDKKYLPDEYQAVRTAVIRQDNNSGLCSVNLTFEEAENARMNGVCLDFRMIVAEEGNENLEYKTVYWAQYLPNRYDVPCYKIDDTNGGYFYLTASGFSRTTPPGGK